MVSTQKKPKRQLPKLPSFRLGFVINPYAGVGGPMAFKGSDDLNLQHDAQCGRIALSAPQRAETFLQALQAHLNTYSQRLSVLTVAGLMGKDAIPEPEQGTAPVFHIDTVDFEPTSATCARDTQKAVEKMCAFGVDLLVFVGGDGTARDVLDVLPERQAALGVPAGVKMHSGVYAINPQCAADLVAMLVRQDLVNVASCEVRDIDEEAFRHNRVKSRYYGEMLVPSENQFVENVKQGGLEVEELVITDISDHLKDRFDHDCMVIFGPGSTTKTIMDNWGLDGTLLGVDVVKVAVSTKGTQGIKDSNKAKPVQYTVLVNDINRRDLDHLVKVHALSVQLVITAIGGQGHIIGRGNQQLSPASLGLIGRERTHIVSTKTKIKNLDGRPLLMDSGDPNLDQAWAGYIEVITGFDDVIYYPLKS